LDIVFRCDFDQIIGGGHLSRCLALARQLPNAFKAIFCVRGEPLFINDHLSKLGVSFLAIPNSLSLSQEIQLLDKSIHWDRVDAIFFDITNSFTFSRISELPEYLEAMSKRVPNSALIDSMDEDSLLHLNKSLAVRRVITPYAGAQRVSGPFEHLFGPEFFILNIKNILAEMPSKKISAIAERITITMGQSDPTSLSLLVLKALRLVANSTPLNIKLVVGPLFSADLQSQINQMAKNYPCPLEILYSPNDMLDCYLWSDITIASTGLTKYELAILGVPAVLISPNKKMAKLQEKYDALGVSLHLGSGDSLSEQCVGEKILNLCLDKPARESLSRGGKRLIDGHGAKRLLDRVLSKL
jgi:UDP-2,4-diacetamido-2,4,6-trideoxy-beta-L-altropyranose hydrolase